MIKKFPERGKRISWSVLYVILISITVILFNAPLLSTEQISVNTIPGDVDENGDVNREDALLLQDYLLDRNELTSGGITGAHANDDEIIDIADVVWIANNPSTSGLIQMVSIPAGTFTMGASDRGDDLTYARSSEFPRHEVTLSAYEIGKYEVTNEECCEILNYALSRGYLYDFDGTPYSAGYGVYYDGKILLDVDGKESGDCMISYIYHGFIPEHRDGYSMKDHPALYVSWYGAVAFCNWLSEMEGKPPAYDLTTWTLTDQFGGGYRLPTEAEWERAAAWDVSSGGKHWIYAYMSDEPSINHMNYDGNNPLDLSDKPYTVPVGYYEGLASGSDVYSPAGCCGMGGNGWEWCHDWFDVDYYDGGSMTNPTGPSEGFSRVARGGDWDDPARRCRTAYRFDIIPWGTGAYGGFRMVRSINDPD